MARRQDERAAMTTSSQPGGPAWFMTEFGATQSVPLLDELTSFTDGLDLGWMYWSWKYYDDPTGSSNEALVEADGSLAPSAFGPVASVSPSSCGHADLELVRGGQSRLPVRLRTVKRRQSANPLVRSGPAVRKRLLHLGHWRTCGVGPGCVASLGDGQSIGIAGDGFVEGRELSRLRTPFVTIATSTIRVRRPTRRCGVAR